MEILDKKELAQPKMQGYLKIWDEETGKLLVSSHNDIHYENASLSIAQALANKKGWIKEMLFGNGGVKMNALNEYTFLPTNTMGSSATLYNEVYTKIVDQYNTNNSDTVNNYMSVSHIDGQLYTDLSINAHLSKGEPSGQNTTNQDGNVISEFSFNEIGLRTYNGYMITHLVFQPILKASNISLKFQYVIRIAMV